MAETREENPFQERRVSRQSFAQLKEEVNTHKTRLYGMTAAILCVALAIFGVNIAAIDITKEVKSTSGTLVDSKTGDAVSTAETLQYWPVTGDTPIEIIARAGKIFYSEDGTTDAVLMADGIRSELCYDCMVTEKQLIISNMHGNFTIQDEALRNGETVGAVPYVLVPKSVINNALPMPDYGTDKFSKYHNGLCPSGSALSYCNNGKGNCASCIEISKSCHNRYNYLSICAAAGGGVSYRGNDACNCALEQWKDCVKKTLSARKCCSSCNLARGSCGTPCNQDDLDKVQTCGSNACTPSCGTCRNEGDASEAAKCGGSTGNAPSIVHGEKSNKCPCQSYRPAKFHPNEQFCKGQ